MFSFTESPRLTEFERQVLPHLDAAYNLARFLMRNDQNAEDIVQEAALRAFRFFETFRGENSRAWFLSIVRNTAFTALKRNRMDEETVSFDEELHGGQIPAWMPASHSIVPMTGKQCAQQSSNCRQNSGKPLPCANWKGCRTKKLQTSLVFRSEPLCRVWRARAGSFNCS